MIRLRTLGLAGAALTLAGLRARSRGRDDRHLAQVRELDPDREYAAITRIGSAYEFPWDTETALSLALFRTFAVPTISRILLDSGAFTEDTRKRYDDTELLLAEVEEHGLDAPRGRAAIRRINRMHAAFPIRPVDMTYVLSTFVVEPRRFVERYGWRDMHPHEIAAGWRYWRELGARMGVTGLPDTVEEFTAWNEAFERAEFRYDPANHAVADATMTMYLTEVYGVPEPLLPAARQAALALLEPELIDALGYDRPPAWVRTAVTGALQVRARALRWFAPPRRRPYRITEVSRPLYPLGYRIEQLGTFPEPAVAAGAGTRDGVLPRDVPAVVGQPSAGTR
ncbi:MAG: oxygenase MpaB family protein [Nitriliruptor sp.]